MKKCVLSIESPTSKVEGKRWMSEDIFTDDAAGARQAMLTALGELQR